MDPMPEPKTLDPRRIRFSGLKARLGVAYPVGEPVYKSDVYVFCFQSQTDPTKWNALDLNQWEFYVMNRHDLIEQKIGYSISLASLRDFRKRHACGLSGSDGEMSAVQFQQFMQVYTKGEKPKT